MSAPKRKRTASNNYIGFDNSSVISNSLFGFRDPYCASDLKLARLAKFTDRGITLTCYTNLSWMTESGFIFPELLRYQGVQCKNGVYQTMVKDRFIILDEDLIADVGGLARFGRPYALAVEYRMMFTLLAYCLISQHTNHTEPTIDDLFLLFAIRERQRVNRPKLILLYMLEFSVATSGSLGYPLLISRIIEEALVDVSDKPFILTDISQHLLLGTCIYNHLNICKVDGAWTYFEDINASPCGNELPPPLDDSNEDTVAHPVHYQALDEVEDDEDDPEEDSDGE
ncbi:hypothetical protein Lal_00042931 [Lupinus albus]|nr:hypothetical protein Lal_00042931 [Lupinus albus]